ncbi:MAG: hypothetical protein SOU14_02080 [Succiniclasticum sp.]|nr:hypothetical protein [Succiniclasticum sp.]
MLHPLVWKGRRGGFLLLEVWLALFACALFPTMLIPGCRGLLRCVASLQLDTVTDGFVVNLHRIREDSMFRTRPAGQYASIDLYGSEGYSVMIGTHEIRRYDFLRDYGAAVQFSSLPRRTIRFTTQGAPKYTGVYTLRHRVYPDLYRFVEIQPVSGRIKVTDPGGFGEAAGTKNVSS